jgi:hypothetical protein
MTGRCPWCSCTTKAVPTDRTKARFVFGGPTENNLRLNPAMCPDCKSVGRWQDFTTVAAQAAA